MTHPSSIPPRNTRRRGRLFVVSAPSGAGKTTLIGRLLKRIPDMAYSVSHTTRTPRRGESDGIDYFFISRDAFLAGIRKGAWAEWAEVHGNYYGTAVTTIEQHLQAAEDVLMDIDVQGAEQIQAKYPDCVTIFIDPPSLKVLQERLLKRGADSEAVIAQRLQNAKVEMAQKHRFDHVVVNDRLEDAVDQMFELIMRYRTQG